MIIFVYKVFSWLKKIVRLWLSVSILFLIIVSFFFSFNKLRLATMRAKDYVKLINKFCGMCSNCDHLRCDSFTNHSFMPFNLIYIFQVHGRR